MNRLTELSNIVSKKSNSYKSSSEVDNYRRRLKILEKEIEKKKKSIMELRYLMAKQDHGSNIKDLSSSEEKKNKLPSVLKPNVNYFI